MESDRKVHAEVEEGDIREACASGGVCDSVEVYAAEITFLVDAMCARAHLQCYISTRDQEHPDEVECVECGKKGL